MSTMKKSHFIPVVAAVLAGCGSDSYEFDSDWHISAERVAEESPKAPSSIPDLVGNTAVLPKLEYGGAAEVYDVVVENADVRLVLNQLADQARLNMDIDPYVGGLISMNAYGQTIEQILERIRSQMAMRFEKVGNSLVIMRDEPYFKQYVVDFPYITRTWSSSADAGLTSTGSGSLGTSDINTSQSGSGSFWGSVESAIEDIVVTDSTFNAFVSAADDIADSDLEALNEKASKEDPLVRGSFVSIVPEAGLVIVFAAADKHKEVAQFLSTYSSVAKRQVQLQATVVEVQLSNAYQHGIDWSLFNTFSNSPKLVQSARDNFLPVLSSGDESLNAMEALGRIAFTGFVSSDFADGLESDGGLFGDEAAPNKDIADAFRDYVDANPSSVDSEVADVVYARLLSNGGDGVDVAGPEDYTFIATADQLSELGNNSFTPQQGGFLTGTFSHGTLQAAVSLLDRFGDTRIVSSPRVSTLNGQGALLKVVTDQVYFSLTRTIAEDDDGTSETTVDVAEEVVPVGFAMSVFPQISADGTIILSLRPSLTRVIGVANTRGDGEGIFENVPVVSVKEIESLMLLNDGETAVLGGLIEDRQADKDTQVPGLGDLPGLGNLFKNVDQESQRVEYVIFVSADVIKNPSLHGDYSDYKQYLPSDEVFDRDNTGTIFGTGRTRAVPRNR